MDGLTFGDTFPPDKSCEASGMEARLAQLWLKSRMVAKATEPPLARDGSFVQQLLRSALGCNRGVHRMKVRLVPRGHVVLPLQLVADAHGHP